MGKRGERKYPSLGDKILKALVYGIARLPFPVLYALSDFLFFVVYHVLKYRRKVVDDNLRHAFPEYTDEQRRKLAKQFFRDLADLALETIKSLKISRAALLKRCPIVPSQGTSHYLNNPNGAVILTAHFGNWEWGGLSFGIHTTNKPVQVVYLKIKDKLFNEIMKSVRTRFGNEVVHMEQSFRAILQQKDNAIVSCFLADQTPQPHQIGHWSMFFNRMTPFFSGPEKIAQKLKQHVYFVNIRKVRRGYYEMDIDLVTDAAESLPQGAIMEKYTRMLEDAVRKQPTTWLWSHRRWKHSYEKYGNR